jgi:hypothetical protein
MAADVKAQEKKAERLLDTITNVGVSEAATRRLKTEEAKLVEMRGKLTALARSGKPKALPAINVETLIADLRSLRTLTEKDPAAARESLLRVVESVVLTPVGDEYEATLALRNSTAAIAGGRVGDKVGCGGAHRTESHTPTCACQPPTRREFRTRLAGPLPLRRRCA